MQSDLGKRIVERLESAGIPVPTDSCLELHERYVTLLSKWNRTINLTSLQLEPLADEAIDRLLIEPIAASQRVELADGIRIIDIGTGGGSPAIPFWIQVPTSQLTMVESRSKKCAFLREAVRQINSGHGQVVESRFENLLESHPNLQGSADIITIRAVRLDELTSDLIGSLLANDGRVFHFSSELSVFTRSTWNIRDNGRSSG